MHDGKNAKALLGRTLDLYKRTGALVRDFGSLLTKLSGREGFVSPIKGDGDIATYPSYVARAKKSSSPRTWMIETFSVPFRNRDKAGNKASRLLCLTVALYPEEHEEPYLKVGILSCRKEQYPFPPSQGWHIFHSMGEGHYRGNFKFEVVHEAPHLVKSNPVLHIQRDDRYNWIEATIYFALPMLSVTTPDELRDWCVQPVLGLWKTENLAAFEQHIKEAGVEGKLTLAKDLPEIHS